MGKCGTYMHGHMHEKNRSHSKSSLRPLSWCRSRREHSMICHSSFLQIHFWLKKNGENTDTIRIRLVQARSVWMGSNMSQFPVHLQVILYVMKVIYLACTKKCWSWDFFFQKKVSTPYNAGTNTVKPRFEVENLEPYGKDRFSVYCLCGRLSARKIAKTILSELFFFTGTNNRWFCWLNSLGEVRA